MTLPAPQPPQLSADNLREMQTARQSLKKIRRAVSAAKFEGYSVAICGGLTAISGYNSIWQMLGGTLLAVIGVIEITGGSRLAKLDATSIRMLTLNQLSLALLILLYALWNLQAEISHPVSDFPDLSASDAQMVGQMSPSMNGLTHQIMLLVYGSMILAAVAEGAMAAYYHSRAAHLQRYLAETPPWIIAMQKVGMRI